MSTHHGWRGGWGEILALPCPCQACAGSRTGWAGRVSLQGAGSNSHRGGARWERLFWTEPCLRLSHNPRSLRDGGRHPGLLLAREHLPGCQPQPPPVARRGQIPRLLLAREHLSPLAGEYPRKLAEGLGVKSWLSPVPASHELAAGQADRFESQDKGRVQTPIEVALGGSASF